MRYNTAKPVIVLHPTPREGDGSPSLQKKVKEERTAEARALRQKNIDRQERRAHKKAGKEGLRRLVARMQEKRNDDGPTDVLPTECEQALVHPVIRKKASSKPARRTKPRNSITPRRQLTHKKWVTLEKRRTSALHRKIKRVLKKILKFAERQGREIGSIFYVLIVEFIYNKFRIIFGEARKEQYENC